MWRLIILLLFLVVSVGLGLTVVQHPGYLLLVYQPWMVQMPLWFALLGLFLAFGLFYMLIDSIDQASFLWYRIKNWFRMRREQKFYSKTQEGLTCLIEARWKNAEKLLLAGANQSVEPLVNYLAAAKAASELGANDRADRYLRKAHSIVPGATLAIGLTQAELQFKQDHFDEARATLVRLQQLSPRHPRVLKLLEKLYVKQGDWEQLHLLLPALRKAKLISTEQAAQFEKNIYCEMLSVNHAQSLESLRQFWNAIPRSVRKHPDVICAYVKRLQAFGGTNDEMNDLICKTLKNAWQPELVRVYADLPVNNLNQKLVVGGAWLKLYGEQPVLLLMLGKVCVKIQLWGKAKDYFERCLAQGPNAEAALNYCMLLEQMGKPEEAIKAYQASLSQLSNV